MPQSPDERARRWKTTNRVACATGGRTIASSSARTCARARRAHMHAARKCAPWCATRPRRLIADGKPEDSIAPARSCSVRPAPASTRRSACTEATISPSLSEPSSREQLAHHGGHGCERGAHAAPLHLSRIVCSDSCSAWFTRSQRSHAIGSISPWIASSTRARRSFGSSRVQLPAAIAEIVGRTTCALGPSACRMRGTTAGRLFAPASARCA